MELNVVKAVVDSGTEFSDSIFKGLGSLFTSDDERNQAKIKFQQALNQRDNVVLQAVAKESEEITKRAQADMASDSTLSKNIRPMTLVYLLAFLSVLCVVSLTCKLSQDQITILQAWISFFLPLTMCVFVFYFGSKGFERVKSMDLNIPFMKKQAPGIVEECIKCGSKEVEPNQFYCKTCNGG